MQLIEEKKKTGSVGVIGKENAISNVQWIKKLTDWNTDPAFRV